MTHGQKMTNFRSTLLSLPGWREAIRLVRRLEARRKPRHRNLGEKIKSVGSIDRISEYKKGKNKWNELQKSLGLAFIARNLLEMYVAFQVSRSIKNCGTRDLSQSVCVFLFQNTIMGTRCKWRPHPCFSLESYFHFLHSKSFIKRQKVIHLKYCLVRTCCCFEKIK